MNQQDPARERLATAEAVLRALDPQMYQGVENWLDRELYGGLYGAGGVEKIPGAHLSAIRELLRARAELHRALRLGTTAPARVPEYTGEAGNERMAQAIESCLDYLSEDPKLPQYKRWDEFWPKW